MSRIDTAMELNNLRLVFSALGLSGELLDDLGFLSVAARALLPPAVLRGRRGPSALGLFPPLEPRRLAALDGKRIGVVVSGGAGATASLVGVQRAFEEAGIRPALISCCSGSALFGSLWAAGLTADEVARFWLGLRDRDYIDPDWVGLARGAARQLRGWGGLLRGEAIERSFGALLEDMTLGETPIRFAAPVWNIDENRLEHVGTRETPELTVARAARVAIAIPLLVGPVELRGHQYGDGGIVDIFPAAPALDADPPLDLVLGVNSYYAEDFMGEDRTGFLAQTYSVVRASGQLRWAIHLELARERVRALGSRLALIHPVPYEETRGLSFYRNFLDRGEWPRAMRRGYEEGRAALDRWAAGTRTHVTPTRSLTREPMTAVDRAWLRMEADDNPMTITSVMFFDQPLSHEALLALAARSVDAHPRLRQRVTGGPTNTAWSPVAHVELAAHITRSRLPEPGGEAELRALVSELGSTPLDRGRPMWALHHVEGYRGGSAVISRLHHAIGDGASLMKLLMSLVGEGAPSYSTAAPGPVVRPEDLLRHKVSAVRSLAHLLASPPDPVTSLRPALCPEKKMAWTRTYQLTELAALAHGAGATTNDVVLAALTGALRRLLHERGERTHDLVLHAVMPVNLRTQERPGEAPAENRFGLVFAPLPLGIEDARARLAAIVRATGEIKRSPEAAVALLAIAALGTMAPALNEAVTKWFGKKGTLVVTNVAGPKSRVALAGVPMGGMVFFVPQSARVGLGVSILSYAGEVRVGIATDAHVCEEPQLLVDAFMDEMASLQTGRIARRRGRAAKPNGVIVEAR